MVLNPNRNGVPPYSPFETGEELLLTGRDAEAKTGHKDLFIRDGKSPEYFSAATSEVSAHISVALRSRLHVHYNEARKKLSRETFVMGKVEVPLSSAFFAHGYVQRASSKRRGEHYIQNYSYLILECHDWSGAIAVAYEHSTAFGSKKAAVSLQRAVYQHEGDLDGDAVMGKGSSKSLDSKKGDYKLFWFVLDAVNDSKYHSGMR